MSKPKGKSMKYLLAALLILLIVLIAAFNRRTTFEQIVLDRIRTDDITSIQMIQTPSTSSEEQKVTVTDRAEIETIMSAFEKIQLRKANSPTSASKAYWISIQVNGRLRFGLRLDNNKHIVITDLEQKGSKRNATYKITSAYGMQSVERFFEDESGVSN